jgi:hypothetical protein
MGARIAYLVTGLTVAFSAAVLIGCAGTGTFNLGTRASWRGQVEQTCLASGAVQTSAYIQPLERIDGPGVCGLERPLRVSALPGGRVWIAPAATIGCPLTAALDRWVRNTVQPASYRYFGRPVAEIKQIASYGCRGRNGNSFGAPSEHAFGNALDVAGFRLASGEVITVVDGWKGNPRERAFLQTVFMGACAQFDTVLGPGSDPFHYNHIHVDLLVTNNRNGHHLCQPSLAERVPVAEAQSEPPSTASVRPPSFTGPGAD